VKYDSSNHNLIVDSLNLYLQDATNESVSLSMLCSKFGIFWGLLTQIISDKSKIQLLTSVSEILSSHI
jgi:hypothetical protein